MVVELPLTKTAVNSQAVSGNDINQIFVLHVWKECRNNIKESQDSLLVHRGKTMLDTIHPPIHSPIHQHLSTRTKLSRRVIR